MSLFIEMKNLFAFLNRRKWVIIGVMILGAVGMMFATPTKKSETPEVEKNQKEYGADIQLIVESKNTNESIINLPTLKYSLVSDEMVVMLKKEGIIIAQADLEKHIDYFIRNQMGDALFLRIHGKDEALVKKLIAFYMDVLTEEKNPYYQTKNIYLLRGPQENLGQLKYFSDIYTATSDSVKTKAISQEGTTQGKINIRNGIIGAVAGLFIGSLVGVYLDAKNKKILAKNYLLPLVHSEADIINSKTVVESVGATQIYLEMLASKATSAILVIQGESSIPNELESKSKDQALQFTVVHDLKAEQIASLDACFIIVKEKETDKKWFAEQYEISHAVIPQLKVLICK